MGDRKPSNLFSNYLKSETIQKSGYLLVFMLLVYFSPLKAPIFSMDFVRNFSLNLFSQQQEDLLPPLITMPLTESSESISGSRCKSTSTISIFKNERESIKYKGVADSSGNFSINIGSSVLKPGDMVWATQSFEGKTSKKSPSYRVIDSKLISWYTNKEKATIDTIKNSTNILLSWSVLIIGGFVYLAIREKILQDTWLLIPTIFIFILSIYNGFSCIAAMTSALSNGIPVSASPSVDLYWLKQIDSFQQGIFLSAVIVLWNIPTPE